MPPEYYGAVACEKGHVLSRVLHTGERADPNCSRCGGETLTSCGNCSAPLRGFRRDVPGGGGHGEPGQYCWSCGEPYPGREKSVADAMRLLNLQLEINEWDDATKERLSEMAGEISSNGANPDIVIATATWLDQRVGPVAKKTLWDIIRTAGSQALIDAVKSHFGLP
jgi:hypothetical protein